MSSVLNIGKQQNNAYYISPENEKVLVKLLKKFKKRILSKNFDL